MRSVFVLLFAILVWPWQPLSAQLCGQNYEAEVSRIQDCAAELPNRRDRLVLVGSSSIRKWPETDTVFAAYEVVNAGFGGSCFDDLWRLKEPLIYALHPDVLIIYEGDNDLHDGVPVEDILATADLLLTELSARLPDTKVVLIAPKASWARQALSDKYLSLNAALSKLADQHDVHWLDFWSVQHDHQGNLRQDLFAPDRLHLNDAGYAVWVDELRRQLPWLKP